MNKTLRFPIVLALATGMLMSLSARATLLDRGNGLIYDDVLDVTWLQDASQGGFQAWDDAVAWADALMFEGFDDWRLPSMSVAGGLPTGSATSVVDCDDMATTEIDCRDNELGYMFVQNLGGSFGHDLTGNQGLIQNIQPIYWSGTENSSKAWSFIFAAGFQGEGGKASHFAAWAVRPGDGLAVPEPATGVLLAVGLGGLGLVRRRRRPTRR